MSGERHGMPCVVSNKGQPLGSSSGIFSREWRTNALISQRAQTLSYCPTASQESVNTLQGPHLVIQPQLPEGIGGQSCLHRLNLRAQRRGLHSGYTWVTLGLRLGSAS